MNILNMYLVFSSGCAVLTQHKLHFYQGTDLLLTPYIFIYINLSNTATISKFKLKTYVQLKVNLGHQHKCTDFHFMTT
jgi:hypothetical protein